MEEKEVCRIIDDYLRLTQAGDLHFNEIAELIHVDTKLLKSILMSSKNQSYIKAKMMEFGMDFNGIWRSVDNLIAKGVFTDLEISSLLNVSERAVRYRRHFKEKNLV